MLLPQFRRGRGVASPPVAAVQFTGSQSYYSTATPGTVPATARVRFRFDAMPTTTLAIVAGSNNLSGGGWVVCIDDTLGGSVHGQLTVYSMVSGVMTVVARKFLMPSDIGRVFTLHLVANNTDHRVYLDGRLMAVPVAGTIAAATAVYNIGGRSDGTFSSPAVSVLDVAEGTTALSAAQVATDVASLVPAFVDQTHRYVAGAGVAGTWTDEVGSLNLTAFGSPAAISFSPTYGRHRGTLEIYGDSIAAGRESGGGAGNGWRRAVEQLCSSVAGKAITLVGKSPSTTSTLDYDYYDSAVGGEGINDRLPILASDLATYGPEDAATLFAYGINDIVALGRTAAQIRTDMTTAVGDAAGARPGRPIFVCNMLPANALTTSQQTEWDSYQSGFAAFIATLQATYPTVVGIDYAGVVTNAADTAQLFDGTHPTPTTYAAMAAVIQPIVSAAM